MALASCLSVDMMDRIVLSSSRDDGDNGGLGGRHCESSIMTTIVFPPFSFRLSDYVRLLDDLLKTRPGVLGVKDRVLHDLVQQTYLKTR